MLRTSPPSAIWPPSSAQWASWPATASSSGRSCKTFTSSAPPTGNAPAPSCQMPASYRCSASLPVIDGFGLDAGRIACVFGGLGQLLHAGLGIIEGDNRFACLEGHVNFADAFDLGNRLLDGDRAGGAGHARYGQRTPVHRHAPRLLTSAPPAAEAGRCAQSRDRCPPPT